MEGDFKKPLLLLFSLLLTVSCGGGGGGSGSDSAPAPNLTPTVSLSSSSTEVDTGSSFTISWSSSNASSCSASGSWSGSKSTSGNETFTTSSEGSYNFSLQCSGSGGSASSSVTVQVTDPTYSIKGVLGAPYSSYTDADVPNQENYQFDNGNPSTAQTLTIPSQVAGHASGDDQWDIYKIEPSKSQYVLLEITNWDSEDITLNDLDLIVIDEDLKAVTWSVGANKPFELLIVPEGGPYYVAVYRETGSSRYVLSVGTELTQNYAMHSYTSHTKIANNEILISPKDSNALINYINAQEQEVVLPEMGFSYQDIISPGKHSIDSQSLRVLNHYSLYPFDNFEQTEFVKKLIENNREVLDEMTTKKIISIYADKLKENFNVSPNFIMQGNSMFSRDPAYPYQWNHIIINTDEAINAIGKETKDVIVAVLDTGRPEVGFPAYNDTEFVSDEMDFVTEVLLNGKQFRDHGGDGDKIDSNAFDSVRTEENDYFSHGTHVASTIAAKNNGSYLNGFPVKVMPIRVLSNHPFSSSTSDVYQGFRYAAGLENASGEVPSKRADVINASLGGGGPSVCSLLDDIIDAGVIIVAAAGNDGVKGVPIDSYPASCPDVISVASFDTVFERAYYSQYNSNVDIAAPGGDGRIDRDGDGKKDGAYAWGNEFKLMNKQGTSMAAPHVAGTVAMMKAVNPDLNLQDIQSILVQGGMTRDIGESGRDDLFGYGALDAAKSVTSAAEYSSSGTASTFAYTDKGSLSFGFMTTELKVNLVKAGSSSLSVVGLLADNTKPLRFTSSTDNEGFGSYTFTLDRSDLAEGTFYNTIYFLMSNNSYPRVSVSYSKGTEPTRGKIKQTYLFLIDKDQDIVEGKILDLDNGEIEFSFDSLDPGQYNLLVTTDLDDDQKICQWGEFCGFYPINSNLGTLIIEDSNVEGIQVEMSLISAVKTAEAQAMLTGQSTFSTLLNKGD